MSESPKPKHDGGGPGKVGVVVVAHGTTASSILAAARCIAGDEALGNQVVAVDAGIGRDEALDARVCSSIENADQGRGVLLLVDLLGSSPCACTLNQGRGHEFAMVTGVNLAMLLKLAALDREVTTLGELANACVASGKKAVISRIQESSAAEGETVG